jgi:CHAT domain-containing protein
MGMLRASLGDWAGAESLLSAALVTGTADSRSPLTRAFRLGLLGEVLLQRQQAAAAEPRLREAIALSESAWALTPRDEGSTVFSGLAVYADLAIALAAQGKAEEAFTVLERGTSRTLAPAEASDNAGRPLRERLQRVLAPDAAMVSWVRDRYGSAREEVAWACVVRASGPPRWIRLGDTAAPLPGGAMRSASLWRELRATACWPMRLETGEADRRLAREVSTAWVAPLAGALAGVHHIIVFSPDLVGSGPLGALCDADGRSLLERYAISYAPSAAFYVMERERPRRITADAAALVVGDPAAGSSDEWPPLRGSRDEIATVRAALPRVRVITGVEASARSLRALAHSGELARYRVLHFATHAQVDPSRLLESALVLAPDRPGERASLLTAREIADSWRLDADLVCLTGCQTALGMRAASQGLLGLQQALFRAGARSVLVSLWPVDDAATALLMQEFYRRLPNASGPGARAEALRQAQRAVRDWRAPDGGRPYAHPAYWAGFTLVGDAG